MNQATRFAPISRLLHWTMAVMVLAMLFIGVGMAASVAKYGVLIAIHRPLGFAILVLAVLRLANRVVHPAPALPDSIPKWQRFAALGSHCILYALMFLQPLVGWAMLSAAPQPIVLEGGWRLPALLAQNAATYATLRSWHTVLAYVFFATILVHFGAALLHAWIRRDGVFESMASLRGAGEL